MYEHKSRFCIEKPFENVLLLRMFYKEVKMCLCCSFGVNSILKFKLVSIIHKVLMHLWQQIDTIKNCRFKEEFMGET